MDADLLDLCLAISDFVGDLVARYECGADRVEENVDMVQRRLRGTKACVVEPIGNRAEATEL